jgi:hypothetical protein
VVLVVGYGIGTAVGLLLVRLQDRFNRWSSGKRLRHRVDRVLPHTDRDAAIRESDGTLLLLRYYTANASKPYCDGAAPTDRTGPGLRRMSTSASSPGRMGMRSGHLLLTRSSVAPAGVRRWTASASVSG